MITLVRDRETIYYAKYLGEEEITKDGLYTGDRRKLYAPVEKTMMPVSGARTAYGFVSETVQMDFFGLNKEYSKTMWTHDKTLGITEETILWLKMGYVSTYSPYKKYAVGDKVIYDGKLYSCTAVTNSAEFDPTAWKAIPHNYIVTGISETPNMVGYAIKEVDLR